MPGYDAEEIRGRIQGKSSDGNAQSREDADRSKF